MLHTMKFFYCHLMSHWTNNNNAINGKCLIKYTTPHRLCAFLLNNNDFHMSVIAWCLVMQNFYQDLQRELKTITT